jgi:dipicolinate synthase subunit A
MKVVFVGGDARQLEVIKKVAELDVDVTIVGFDQLHTPLDGAVHGEFDASLFSDVDALVLPAVGTDDEGRVLTVFSDQEIVLKQEHMAALPRRAIVFCGMAKPYLKELCHAESLQLVELFARDDISIYNAIPTAEGALMLAIQNTDVTVHGANVVVLGMGRTGQTLAHTLQGVGAKVRMGVRRDEHYARALQMNFAPFYMEELPEVAQVADLVFNTVPAMVVTPNVIANLPARAVIIDLASKPGGTDFRFAERRGVKAMLAPSLPGIVAPRTAGRIIADCLTELLRQELARRGQA